LQRFNVLRSPEFFDPVYNSQVNDFLDSGFIRTISQFGCNSMVKKMGFEKMNFKKYEYIEI